MATLDSVSFALLSAFIAAFLAGGIVKGTLGVGLPLVTVPLLSLVMPSPIAISLVSIPVLASNLWQAYDSGVSLASLRRFAPLMLALATATLITVPMTLAMPVATLNAMLAGAVLLAVALMALKPRFDVAPRWERVASFFVGGISGILGGISSLTGPIIISYLTALRLQREEFVAVVSAIYLCSAIPLYGSMALYGRLGAGEIGWSLASLIPMALGLSIGKWLRGRLSEEWFRRSLLLFLSAVAITLLFKGMTAPASA